MLPGLLAGLLLGGAGTWWVMRRQVVGEARRLARVMAEEAAGPRAPTPLAGVNGRAESGQAGAASGAAAVPVIEVAENLEDSFKALLAIADPAVRQAALARFLENLPLERWGSFLQAVKKVGDRGEFEDQPGSFMAALGLMESTFRFMMKREPEGLLSLVSETRDGQEINDDAERDDDIANMAFRFWAGHDLPAAMAYFDKNLGSLPPDKQREAAQGLAREFVKKDPAGAFAWIKGLPKENQAQVAHGAFQTLSHTDSEAALRFLVTEKELPNRDEFAEQMAKGWAATKPEEALAWAKGLPEDLSPRAVQGAMEHLAEKNFEVALKEVAVLAPAQQDGALKALADNLTDPSRVAGVVPLIEQSPEGDGRAEAARAALNQWTKTDAEAASAWVAAQPDGPTRDASIQGFGAAAVASKKDPEAGLEWTATMSNPKLREQWLGNNLRNWAGYDSEAARAWVQSSPRLSDADREVLLPLTRK
jgi:hypothetical protein